MKATVYLKAETEEDEEALKTFISCHFQTHIQDFLEEEADMWDHQEVVCSIPDVTYTDRNGNEIVHKSG